MSVLYTLIAFAFVTLLGPPLRALRWRFNRRQQPLREPSDPGREYGTRSTWASSRK